MGVTLHHPHGQIYAYPFIPPRLLQELSRSQMHFEDTGRCLLCDIVGEEPLAHSRHGERQRCEPLKGLDSGKQAEDGRRERPHEQPEEHLHEEHPDVPIFTCAVDETLDQRGFIVPGLGDVGDRLYGTE